MQKTFTKITFAVLAGLLALTVKAQTPTTCSVAASYSYPINQTVSGYTDSYYWFQVTLGAGNYKIAVNSASSADKINRADVYTGSCSSLSLYATDTLVNPGDSSFFIPITNTVSTSYYVRLSNLGSPTTFTVNTTVYCWIVGNLGFCPGQQVQLTTILGNASGTSTYSWSPSTGLSSTNTPTTTATPTAAITYTLTYNDANGTYTNTAMVVPLPTSDCNSCEMTINGSFEAIQGESNTSSNVGQPSAVQTGCGSITYFDPSNWFAPTCGTSDYYNANYLPQGGNGVYVPTNFMTASTPANSGNGYAGFYTESAPLGSNYREYVQEQLKCGLVTGQLYNVSMYTSLAEYAHYATNNIGAYLSVATVTNTVYAATNLPYTPQVNASNIIPTYGTWAQITGTITGNGEQYITVGNFYDDTHTTYTASTSPNAHANHYAYYFIDDISVTPATPTLSATSTCSGSTFTLTATGAASAYTTWQGPNSYTASGSVVSAPTPTANGTYTCTVNLSSACPTCTPITQTISISVTPTITIVASPTTICVNQSSTLTASGASSYSWSPSSGLSATTGSVVTASPTVTTTYSVVSTGTNVCVGTNTLALTVSGCTVCPTCTASIAGTVTVSPASYGSYCINNNITISGIVSFIYSEFKIAPNVTITLLPGSSLNINNSHLYACSGMWQGIIAPSTSTVAVSSNSLIEDAYVAMSSSTSTNNQMATVSLSGSTFNKNQVSLQVTSTNTISPPSGSTYPITVDGCVFTSRIINTSGSTMPNWPATSTIITYSTMPSPLQTPYLNAYTVTTCKNGDYPLHGIELNNVGVTTGAPTSPVYSEVYLGNSKDVSIYDSHYYDIFGQNSNITVQNSVFQNGQYKVHGPQGTGIQVSSTDNAIDNYRLRVTPVSAPTSGANSFYNLYTLVSMYHYLETDITYNYCYSTAASYTTTSGPSYMYGQTGLNLVTNRYTQILVDHNNMYNIATPVIFTADVGNYYNGSGLSNGRYSGQVSVTNNFIRPHVPGNTITNQFVSAAISATDVMGSPSGYTNGGITGANVNLTNNIIDKVWYGIYASSFALQPVKADSNYVTIVKALNGTSSPTSQYGIDFSSINKGTINYNNLESNIGTTDESRNITVASSGTLGIGCNVETGGYRGMEFNGTNTIQSLSINTFSNNAEGLALDNSGIIGQQGNANDPEDNQWLGTWGTSNTSFPYKTGTHGLGSSAQNSPIFVRTSGTYSPTCDPNGNGYTDQIFGSATVVGTNYYVGTSPTIGTYSHLPAHALYTCPVSVPTCTNCRGTQPEMTPQDSASFNNIRDLKEKVVMHAIKYDPQDSAINCYLSRMNIYRTLRGDTNNLQGSGILRNFYNFMQSSNMEKLSQVEDALLSGDFSTAQSKVASVGNANSIENNYLTYYNTLINYKKGAMTSSDSSNLLSLAQGCPFTDGNVVYQARALYNIINSPYTVFKNNCNQNISNRVAQQPTAINGSATTFDAYVYPNPNAGREVFIAPTGLTNGNLQIRLTDLEGRTVYESDCTVTDGLSNIKIAEIKNGVYFVHITNTITGEKVVKKLVIQY